MLISLAVFLPAANCALAIESPRLSSDEFWYCPTPTGSFLVLQVAREKSLITRIGYKEKDKKAFAWQEVIGQTQSAVSMNEKLYVIFKAGLIFRFGGTSLQLPRLTKDIPRRIFADDTTSSIFLLAMAEDNNGKTPLWNVFKLTEGKWQKTTSLPVELNRVANPEIIANNGWMKIFTRPKDEQLKVIAWNNGKWKSERNIDIKPETERYWPLALPQTEAVVCKTNKAIYIYNITSGKKQPLQPTPLKIKGSTFLPADSLTVTTIADRIAIGTLDEKNKVVNISYWTPEGRYVNSENPVKPFVTSEPPKEPSILFTILMVITVILAIFSRGTAIPPILEIPEGFMPADYWRRALAFMLDFFPISFLGSAIGYNYIKHIPPDASLLEYIQTLQNDPNMYYLAMIVSIVYIAYCIIMEGKFGWTVGKKLLALEVRQIRSLDKHANWVQIVLRNLVKILELNFPPLLFVIVINRQRQRLGDMLAGTVVLQKKKTAGGIDERA